MAADKVCVHVHGHIFNTTNLQASSNLFISVEHKSIYKAKQGWSALKIAFVWPVAQVSWTESAGWQSCKSLWSHRLVLFFVL